MENFLNDVAQRIHDDKTEVGLVLKDMLSDKRDIISKQKIAIMCLSATSILFFGLWIAGVII